MKKLGKINTFTSVSSQEIHHSVIRDSKKISESLSVENSFFYTANFGGTFRLFLSIFISEVDSFLRCLQYWNCCTIIKVLLYSTWTQYLGFSHKWHVSKSLMLLTDFFVGVNTKRLIRFREGLNNKQLIFSNPLLSTKVGWKSEREAEGSAAVTWNEVWGAFVHFLPN